MTGAAVLGPWPGTDVLEAQSAAVGDLTEVPEGVEGLPALVDLPDRGPHAWPLARTCALLSDLPVELGVHGWMLADRPGQDVHRAQGLLREDLDALAVAAHGYSGRLVLAVRGPWTLAATLYLARGDRVLSDPGAVRELRASLIDGLQGLIGRMRTGVPGARPVVVLDEPLLAEVLGGGVPTFSGHGYLWSVEGQVASTGLGEVAAAVRSAGASVVVVRVGSRRLGSSLPAVFASGPDAVGLALESIHSAEWERVAEFVEGGGRLWAGLGRPSDRPGEVERLVSEVRGPWTAVGLPAAGLGDVVVHVDGGSGAGTEVGFADLAAVRAAIRAGARVAAGLAEVAAG